MRPKLCVSHIAWTADEESAAADLLQELSVQGVEVAPTRVGSPDSVSAAELSAYRAFWERRGIAVVAMQALLFGRPELRVFGTAEQQEELLAYLERVARLGAALGAGPLVFGSPRNRSVEGRTLDAVWEQAVSFFRRAGERVAAQGCVLCIEPNPAAYGCDFIHTAQEAARLVRAVAHSGFRLHLDASSFFLNGEDATREIQQNLDILAHFHISEPHLSRVGSGSVNHRTALQSLMSAGYSGWVSIEMRSGPQGSNVAALREALSYVCPLLSSSSLA